jgi:hypothetical protein
MKVTLVLSLLLGVALAATLQPVHTSDNLYIAIARDPT